MNNELRQLLEGVKSGEVSIDDAVLKIKRQPFDDLGFAKVDLHRKYRQGTAEVIFGSGKTAEQILAIAESMLNNGQETILITRLASEKATELDGKLPITYHEMARIGVVGKMPQPDGTGTIVVATGGTSDMPVSEEAALTAEVLGNKVTIMGASVIIAIAGMEGALASVIGGMADCPVIAVPTSVGYGASFHGLSALLSMLNSCASGVAVVNIDNGFGAGYMANMINHK